MSRELFEHEMLTRSLWRCEHIDKKWGTAEKRCIERHLENAVTFKGKVILRPYYFKQLIMKEENCVMLCQKHLNIKIKEKSKERKPKKKLVPKNQTSLL